MAATVGDIVITQRNGRNATRLLTSDLRASWEVNRAGSLSCRVTSRDLTASGWSGDLLGAWLQYGHPTAGRWGGVVTSVGYADGIVEIGAQSFHVLTRKRLVRATDDETTAISGTPGGLFKKLFRLASAVKEGHSSRIPLTLGDIDESGTTLEVTYADDDLYDGIIPSLTDDIGYEWTVTPDRVVNFGKRIGEDRTSRVVLVEGRHIANSRWTDDIWNIENWLVGYGTALARLGNMTAEYRTSAVGANARSIERYGVLMGTRDYGGPYDSERTVAELVRAEVGESSDPDSPVELTVVDEDDCWSLFREGDTVSVRLPQSGIRGTVRVMVRALDLNGGRMTVSGIGANGS